MNPTVPMYLLQSLQGHLSVVQSFIFFKKISCDFHFQSCKGQSLVFCSQGKICFLFQSTLCSFFAFAELNYFSDCMVSVQSEKYLSLCKFLLVKFVDFVGEYLLICPFPANHLEIDLFHLFRQFLKLFL